MYFYWLSHGKKGWKVYDTETREIFVSRDVIFHEAIYPYAQIEQIAEKNVQQIMGWNPHVCYDEADALRLPHALPTTHTNEAQREEIGQSTGTAGCGPFLLMDRR